MPNVKIISGAAVERAIADDADCAEQSRKCAEAFRALNSDLNAEQKERLFNYESEIASYERVVLDAVSEFIVKEINGKNC